MEQLQTIDEIGVEPITIIDDINILTTGKKSQQGIKIIIYGVLLWDSNIHIILLLL